MSNNLGQIYATSKQAEKYIILDSQNVEVSGNFYINGTNSRMPAELENSIRNYLPLTYGTTDPNTNTLYDVISEVSNNLLISNNDASFNNVTVDGTLNSDDITGSNVTVSNDLVVSGNLRVNGTQTIVNSTTLDIGDNKIVVNADGGSTPSAGIIANVNGDTSSNNAWGTTGNLSIGSNLNISGAITGDATTVTSLTSSGTISGGDTTVTSLSTAIAGTYGYGSITGGVLSIDDRIQITSSITQPSSSKIHNLTFKAWTKADGTAASEANTTTGTNAEAFKISSYNDGGRYGTDDADYFTISMGPNDNYPQLRFMHQRWGAFSTLVAGSWYYHSDDRLKHNEQVISNALSTIRLLSPQTYDKSNELNDASNTHVDAGFIAQEVAQIPELAHYVHTGSDTEIWHLNYTPLFTYAVAGLKELDAIVQSQQTEIDSLEARLTALENRSGGLA
jgi:hypothetical protein